METCATPKPTEANSDNVINLDKPESKESAVLLAAKTYRALHLFECQINQLRVESLKIFPLSSLFLDLQLFFWKKVQKRPIMLKLHVCWLV